jgi:hypothetical protein
MVVWNGFIWLKDLLWIPANTVSTKFCEILEWLSDWRLLKKDMAPRS